MAQMWIKGTYLVEEKLTKCWPHRFAPLFSLERFLMCIVLQCFSLEAKFLGSSKVIAMPSPTKWARWWSILNWPFMFWFFSFQYLGFIVIKLVSLFLSDHHIITMNHICALRFCLTLKNIKKNRQNNSYTYTIAISAEFIS